MSPSAKLLLMLYLQQSRIASVLQILVPGDTIIISFYNKTDYKAFLCSTELRWSVEICTNVNWWLNFSWGLNGILPVCLVKWFILNSDVYLNMHKLTDLYLMFFLNIFLHCLCSMLCPALYFSSAFCKTVFFIHPTRYPKHIEALT